MESEYRRKTVARHLSQPGSVGCAQRHLDMLRDALEAAGLTRWGTEGPGPTLWMHLEGLAEHLEVGAGYLTHWPEPDPADRWVIDPRTGIAIQDPPCPT
jgi:hypothetical protein